MKELFRINTSLFSLVWERVAKNDPPVLAQRTEVRGRLVLTPRSNSLVFQGDNWRSDVPKGISTDPTVEVGPAFYEQTDYQIYLKAHHPTDEVSIQHRDPQITQRLSTRENKRVEYGVINFQGQIGRSLFTVEINGKPQLDFELEVFPTKIDYETDYQEILSQVQEILTSLAYEFLRSTHQLGKLDMNRRPSRLEWLVLLEHILGELEKSVRYIAQQPRRSLVLNLRFNRIERIRRTDSSLRAQVRRGAGRGVIQETLIAPVRERLLETPSEPTLDTMEHRWIRHQLTEIRRTLGQLYSSLRDASAISERSKTTQLSIRRMENRVSQLLRLEPLAKANGPVRNEIASLQLVSAPGYRETYGLCKLLKFGIRLEGELFRMSVKDLNILYEYWVFLSIVHLLREPNVNNSDLRDLFKINRSSLQVRLREGRRQRVNCIHSKDRKISVTYNFQYNAEDVTLIPQKPDIIIRYEEVGWPQILLVCDAKYRIDASEEYREQFGSFGPPRDAINLLHRYRDAILEFEKETKSDGRPKHVVVQAVAAFPYSELQPREFHSSRLWQAIDRFGIGAVPALPSNLSYMREWLIQAFRQGGWAMADRAIPHIAEGRARDWRFAASEPVLVGTLRGQNPHEHFSWIESTNSYYIPFSRNQPRQLLAKQVAIYSPQSIHNGSAITHIADVRDVEIVKRSEIKTPWSPRFSEDEKMVLYHVSSLSELAKPIKYHSGDKTSILAPRWSTKLGIQRARLLSEIALETEPEWRLYEKLNAVGVDFQIEAMSPKKLDQEDPVGRAFFKINQSTSVRFDGKNGFLVSVDGAAQYLSSVEDILSLLGIGR